METYQISGLTFRYPLQTEPALQAIDVSIQPGELILLCGRSGCGKTTLLRHLKTVLTPHGKRSGRILYAGTVLERVDQRRQAQEIGFVLQSPDNQIVTDKVWHELAFGLESLGCNSREIRLRVAEMASYFGIQDWFYRNVSELSGGQKQLLNLAAIMVMQPAVLILDEPTSQLDPIAAADFLATLKKINRDLGTTIIMTEQRLEEALPLSDRVLVMDRGRIVSDAVPRETADRLRAWQHEMFQAMPAPLQIHAGVKSASPAPVTVGEGRQWLDTLALAPELPGRPDPASESAPHAALIPALEAKNIWFKYEKNHPDVLKGLSLQVHQGQIQAVAGGNGTGKTTLLHLLAGIVKPYHGKVLVFGQARGSRGRQRNEARIAVLPQNPQALLVQKTVALDLLEMLEGHELSREQRQQKITAMAERVGLTGLLTRHPYDLSCGELQRAALAKVLLLEPQILLLDEPTKGLDSHFKAALGVILKSLAAEGVAILMVSHDIEFCARHADRCALLFDGVVVSENTARKFFAGNSFYTTAANRMARHLFPDVVTSEDVIAKCSAYLENQNAGPAMLRTLPEG